MGFQLFIFYASSSAVAITTVANSKSQSRQGAERTH